MRHGGTTQYMSGSIAREIAHNQQDSRHVEAVPSAGRQRPVPFPFIFHLASLDTLEMEYSSLRFSRRVGVFLGSRYRYSQPPFLPVLSFLLFPVRRRAENPFASSRPRPDARESKRKDKSSLFMQLKASHRNSIPRPVLIYPGASKWNAVIAEKSDFRLICSRRERYQRCTDTLNI